MPILNIQEAAEVLGYTSPDEMPGNVSSIILPAVDDFLKTATGKDWGADNSIDPTAKIAASVLLVRWFDDPGLFGKVDAGIISLAGQLAAKALIEVNDS